MGKAMKSAAIRIKDAVTTNAKTVRAVVTAPTVDRDYEIIDTPSLRLPLKSGGWIYARELTGNEQLDIPFLLNHSMVVEDVIGSVKSGIVNELGELEAEFAVSSLPKAQDMLTLLDEGHLGNAFSITISDYQYGDDGVFYDGEVIEISLVFKGSNRNARLLAVSKSLLKGDQMAEATKSPELVAKYEQLEALTKEIEAAEAKAEKPVAKEAEPEVKAETKVEVTPSSEEASTEAEDKEEEDDSDEESKTVEQPATKPEPTQPQTPPTPGSEEVESKEVTNEETTMTETESKAISTKAAAVKPNEVETAPKVVQKADPNAHKLITAKQINAWNSKNWDAIRELNEQARKLDEEAGITSKAIKSKELSYAETNPLYLAEQVSRDVELCRGEYGLSPLVTKINLTESPKFRTLTQDGDIDFVPVGWAGTKPEDETGFGSVSVEPKPFAVIQVWNDHAADDALVNLYNIMVQNVADAEARLDDRLIATFETVTADGLVYPTQGLIPRIDEDRVFEHGTAGAGGGTGAQVFTALLAALGSIRNCDANNITVAFNRSYIYTLAGLRNTNGDLIFTGTGNTLNMGMIGNVRFVTTDILDAGDVLVGNFRRGYLANKGGLELTTSNQAVVGSRNLFTTDHTALRAVVRKEFDVSDGSLGGAFAIVRPTPAA